MAYKPKIVAFAGSLRKDSFNKKIAKIAADGAENAGAEVTFIDLRDYPMPIFDQDEEAESGLPENAEKLQKIFKEQDGFIISSPEYNSSVTAVLKNTIDWVSRPPSENLSAFKGKVAVLMSASPGGLGGLRGLVHIRATLGNIGVTVLPQQIAVSAVHDALDEKGDIKDSSRHEAIKNLGADLAETCRKLKS